jgi:hypothetical protein
MTLLEENAMRAIKQIPTLLGGIEGELKRIADALDGRRDARAYPEEPTWVCPPNPTYNKSNKED